VREVAGGVAVLVGLHAGEADVLALCVVQAFDGGVELQHVRQGLHLRDVREGVGRHQPAVFEGLEGASGRGGAQRAPVGGDAGEKLLSESTAQHFSLLPVLRRVLISLLR
jgi:hypothetical protein